MSKLKKVFTSGCIFEVTINHCPLLRIFWRKSLNNKINKLHDKCLPVICNNKQSKFAQLLKQDIPVSTHTRNFKFLQLNILKILDISGIKLREFHKFDRNSQNFVIANSIELLIRCNFIKKETGTGVFL